MANGGRIAQRGFIFQSIIAMIECLDRSDWDAIKVEPETVNDKVDIMFYRNGRILSAIQVKSEMGEFCLPFRLSPALIHLGNVM